MAKKINAAQTIGDEETELPDRSTRLQQPLVIAEHCGSILLCTLG